MNEKIIENYQVAPQSEQETIITYERDTKEWHIFTDIPHHAKKYESLIDSSKYFRKGYNDKKAIVMLEGTLKECNVTISKKRKREMTDEQRKAASERMKQLHADGKMK